MAKGVLAGVVNDQRAQSQGMAYPRPINNRESQLVSTNFIFAEFYDSSETFPSVLLFCQRLGRAGSRERWKCVGQ